LGRANLPHSHDKAVALEEALVYLGFNTIFSEIFKNNLTKERFFTWILKSIISMISKGREDLSHRALHIKNTVLYTIFV
jgi:hypothetical protein